MKSNIYLGADHAGWQLKTGIEEYLKEKGYPVIDMGNQNLVENDDYPDFGYAVAKRVATDIDARGIVFCGNAQGICIVANKVPSIRAATGFNEEVAQTSRNDDNANVLCLPGQMMDLKNAKKIVDIWLETPFSNAERHQRRLNKVTEIEKQEFNQ